MKKVLSIILSISLCLIMPIQVSAMEVIPKENVVEKEKSNTSTHASNSFSKSFPKLISANGIASNIAAFSTGSISSSAQITSISIYVRVSTGSDPFILYVQAPDGTIYSFVITKSGTITINDFNGCDPSGTWKIWIETQGTVSTISGTFKVNYSY